MTKVTSVIHLLAAFRPILFISETSVLCRQNAIHLVEYVLWARDSEAEIAQIGGDRLIGATIFVETDRAC
jgi:hypothetical protein